MSIIIIGGVAGVFALAGLFGKLIAKGALALSLATIPILLFIWCNVYLDKSKS